MRKTHVQKQPQVYPRPPKYPHWHRPLLFLAVCAVSTSAKPVPMSNAGPPIESETGWQSIVLSGADIDWVCSLKEELGRLWSIQGSPLIMSHSLIQMPHSKVFSFLLGVLLTAR